MNSYNEVDTNEAVSETFNTVDPEQARIILEQEFKNRERQCAQEVQEVLKKYGFQLSIEQSIKLNPI